MTGDFEIDTRADDGTLGRARGLMLRDMPGFIAWVEVDATARRAVIASEVHCGIEEWLDLYEYGRDACLAIECRIAAEEALSAIEEPPGSKP